MNKYWLNELLDLLDRGRQPSLIKNMIYMKIQQTKSKSISLKLQCKERTVANRVVIYPMRKGLLYEAEFFMNNLPTSGFRDLTLSEVKLLINKYTVLELV